MKWSPQQDRALKHVSRWLKSGDQPVFRLFGYAGTGKTTLARSFAEDIEGPVLYGAFTGKAAYVLRTKGCEGASTIHSMIYKSKEKGKARLKEIEVQLAELMHELTQEGLIPEQVDNHRRVQDLRRMLREERKNASRPMFDLNTESVVREAALVIIDECSMVDAEMGNDLLSFGTKVLVLGDPAQLPPVGGAGYFTEGVDPDTMLTDIHRQAADNPIIDLATRTRNKQAIPLGTYGTTRVVEGTQIDKDDALAADQILVGRNKTRHASNARMRNLLGYANMGHPCPGDKLVCLRNNHELGLLNGSLWAVDDVGSRGTDRVVMTVDPEDDGMGGPLTVEAHMHHFQGRSEDLPWYERKEAEEFDYGYALTVHKSQGSQWNDVLLFDESGCFREDRWRWLYTGITRAAEKLTVVRM